VLGNRSARRVLTLLLSRRALVHPSTPAHADSAFHTGACWRDLVSRPTARGLREGTERRLVGACSDGGRASQAEGREAQEAGEVRGPRSRCGHGEAQAV